jgi:hypothetical protein
MGAGPSRRERNGGRQHPLRAVRSPTLNSEEAKECRLKRDRHALDKRGPIQGLLRLYSRYSPSNRSATQGDLCREAPTRPVTRPSRSPASGPIDNYPGGTLLH